MEIWKAIFLALVLACVSFAGISVSGYTVSKDFFRPGEPGVATITVSNPTGSESVSSLTMTLDTPSELIVTSAPKLADITSGGSTVVTIPFRVRDDARPGIYLLNAVFLGYVRDPATSLAKTTTNTVAIPVTIVNEPELSMSADKRLLSGVDDVVLTITNDGGIANNLRIRILGEVSLYGTDQLYVGTVTDQASAPVSLDSRDAEDGPLDMMIIISYEDELGLTHDENTTLRMTVRNEKLDLQFIQQGDVVTRQDSTLTLQIKNSGTETLKDVRLSFLDSGLRLSDHSELKFGDIAPGTTATASGPVFAELPPGLNLVDAELSWIEKDVQREESRSIPITITSDADVGVFLEARPLPLTIGTEHTISVLVSNLGSYSIENVEVEFSSPVLRSMDISDKQYIGGLQKDDFSTVQFLVKVNASSPGTYPASIKITYRDQSGEWKTKSVVQDIAVYNGTAQQADPLPFVFGGVLLAAVLIWFFKFRKK